MEEYHSRLKNRGAALSPVNEEAEDAQVAIYTDGSVDHFASQGIPPAADDRLVHATNGSTPLALGAQDRNSAFTGTATPLQTSLSPASSSTGTADQNRNRPSIVAKFPLDDARDTVDRMALQCIAMMPEDEEAELIKRIILDPTFPEFVERVSKMVDVRVLGR